MKRISNILLFAGMALLTTSCDESEWEVQTYFQKNIIKFFISWIMGKRK